MKPYNLQIVVDEFTGSSSTAILCGSIVLSGVYRIQEDPFGFAQNAISILNAPEELKEDLLRMLPSVAKRVYRSIDREDLIARYKL